MRPAFKWSTILFAVIVFIPICINSAVYAFSIIIKNGTSVALRVDALEDNCGNVLIEKTNPVSLAPGGWVEFKNVVPVVHHYRMCANGTCEGSSLGIMNSEEQYTMVARLIQGCICVRQTPLLWPGMIECTKPKYEL